MGYPVVFISRFPDIEDWEIGQASTAVEAAHVIRNFPLVFFGDPNSVRLEAADGSLAWVFRPEYVD